MAFFSKSDKDNLTPTDPKIPFSLRTTRTTWIKDTKQAKPTSTADPKSVNSKNGPPVIVFMLGGLSFSEMRVAYEVSKEWNRDIFIGKSS